MIVGILLSLSGLCALVWLSVFAFVCVAARARRPLREADCVAVLGAKLRADGSMTGTLARRVETAYRAARLLPGAPVIVSGGRMPGEPRTEAAAMAEALTKMGLPAERIVREDKSLNTAQNFDGIGMIMAEMGLRSALIVTSDYHMARALRIAKDGGVTAYGYPAPSPARRRSYWRARLRETMGWGLYARRKIFGK